MFLIMVGVTPRPLMDSNSFQFADRYGNEILLPTSTTWSLFFSALSMGKTMICLNIFLVHLRVSYKV